MKQLFKRWIIIIVITLFVIVPLLLYYQHFGSRYLSDRFQDWIAFSQYYILFITLANSAIILYLTWKIHKENIALNKPILIFTIKNSDSYPHFIKNIGNGPAINIEIYHSQGNVGWDRKIKGLTLGKGEEYPLKIGGQNRLGATYYDQTEHMDRCYMKDCVMRFKNIESEFSQKIEANIFIWEVK